ncbi:MAG TPA: glycosyltransferase [Thermomicrobiales bacterium]|nr:glycosyltransferase [Thermomicrobiales bacterium]
MLTARPTLYAIGDARDATAPLAGDARRAMRPPSPAALPAARATLRVVGGYIERLPLAAVKCGLVDDAEAWSYVVGAAPAMAWREQPMFGRRLFRLADDRPPFHSPAMLRFLRERGAPDLLCVWGLGVSEEILLACRDSFKLYYSLDVDPLRVPPAVSRHFDLVLVGETWQADAARARHPALRCARLPIGPEFADPLTFRPLGIAKDYDVIYVACAQTYKRHDILFQALARCARPVRTLCVFGYGELADDLRARARALGLAVDFVGPPGVPHATVNALMNRARIGVVAGSEDGCPAILTEYMLAGLPVLANQQLCCGLRYITPETGLTATPEAFHLGLEELLARAPGLDPRAHALGRWDWPTSIRKLTAILADCGYKPRRPIQRVN